MAVLFLTPKCDGCDVWHLSEWPKWMIVHSAVQRSSTTANKQYQTSLIPQYGVTTRPHCSFSTTSPSPGVAFFFFVLLLLHLLFFLQRHRCRFQVILAKAPPSALQQPRPLEDTKLVRSCLPISQMKFSTMYSTKSST
jgi:hypothetical protein